MSKNELLTKLRRELELEVTTERQVVYILVEIRKLLEREGRSRKYYALNFYCSWALHTTMGRAAALRIMQRFDRAHPFLLKREKLPDDLRAELGETTTLQEFREQLSELLYSYALPTRIVDKPDAWQRFLRLYGLVVRDCDLELTDQSAKLNFLQRISCHLLTKFLKWEHGTEVLFCFRWTCYDKSGQCGHWEVYSSFRRKERKSAAAVLQRRAQLASRH